MRGGAGVKPTRERRPCRALTCLREPLFELGILANRRHRGVVWPPLRQQDSARPVGPAL